MMHDNILTWVDALPAADTSASNNSRSPLPRWRCKRKRPYRQLARRGRPRFDHSSQSLIDGDSDVNDSDVNDFDVSDSDISDSDISDMDDDTDASCVTSLSHLEKLNPISPLKRRKAAQSPERVQRVILEEGTPPIRIRPPGGTELIQSAWEIRVALSKDFGSGYIPVSFKVSPTMHRIHSNSTNPTLAVPPGGH